ncbi:MAG: formate--tetrahydrofolate ligase, partial [Methylovirgula sp.]
MPTNIEIARTVELEPIMTIAERAGVPAEAIEPYGKYIGKVDLHFLAAAHERAKARAKSKLIVVTAISPTPAGEGKTTTSIGLVDAIRRLGKRIIIALREPSLGPCFGVKGGACGGGRAQVAPMEAINLHFTGDIHAISAANNLLAALIDNHIFFGNELNIDLRRIPFGRAMDMNDRALREMVIGLGGNGYPRETRFDITAASEIMAIFCLARDIPDLQRRLARLVFGFTRDKKPLTA